MKTIILGAGKGTRMTKLSSNPKFMLNLVEKATVDLSLLDKTKLTIDYEVTGSGSPLVFIHGAGNEYTDYSLFLKDLAEKYTVYSYTFPDYRSQTHTDLVNIDSYISVLKQLLTIWQLDNVTLCGYSLGGGIALAFAARNMIVVKKVIAICPILEPREKSTSELVKDWLSAVRQKLFELPISLNLKKELRSLSNINLTKNIIAFTNTFDIRDHLDEIQTKCEIFLGENDKYLDYHRQIQLLNSLKNKNIISYKNGSHYIIFSKRKEIIQSIKSSKD